MRQPKFYSPSALARWEYSRDEFYLKYLADNRPERDPQLPVMAAGSSFDAFVKNKIHSDVFGPEATKGTPYEFDTIFQEQVEEQCRDESLELGKYLFKRYNEVGAYIDLLMKILESPEPPQMEFEAKGTINGIPLLGKPDLKFYSKELVHIIGDWKVNGSYSKHGVSPTQGYQTCRSLKKGEVQVAQHKKYKPSEFKDVELNESYLEEFDEDWATQLAIYAWLMGEQPGKEDFVVRMEQLACRPGTKASDFQMQVKCASHVAKISSRFQLSVMMRLTEMHQAIQSGHIFTDLTLEQSIEHGELLEKKAALPIGLHPAMDVSLTERKPRWKS